MIKERKIGVETTIDDDALEKSKKMLLHTAPSPNPVKTHK